MTVSGVMKMASFWAFSPGSVGAGVWLLDSRSAAQRSVCRKAQPVVKNTTTSEVVPIIVDEESGSVSFSLLPGNHYQLNRDS